MTAAAPNVDPEELKKFSRLAERWWDPRGEFRVLHDLNPLRLDYIEARIDGAAGRRALDVGCGGGLLAEGLARRGAEVVGIDMAEAPLAVARLHLRESQSAHAERLKIDYRRTTAEALAEAEGEAGRYDLVACLEMLEHVPDPAAVVAACARLTRPGGTLIFSTINRNPRAWLLAIVGAEYLLNLLPRGTHDYDRFIRPSELEGWTRAAGLELRELTGLAYNPFTKRFSLGSDVGVNYLACAVRP